MARSIKINDWLWIDDGDIDLVFIRAAGPGGQNVNRVESAVQLRYRARQSRDLPGWVYERLGRVAGRRLTSAGEIVITARRHRTQEANRNEAIARLKALLGEAAHREAVRIPTWTPPAAKRRRLDDKKRRTRRKAERSEIPD